jgi:indole-3-acetate monooxygenase
MTSNPTTTAELAGQGELPQRARDLIPLLDEESAAGDERGQLTEKVVDALHESGMFGMWVPRGLGGSEQGPVDSLRTIEQLSYGDPSAGWVLMAAGLAIGTGGLYLGDDAVADLFGAERLPVIAGQGTRPGKAVAADGGFRLSGSWSFASGLKHSGFIHTLAVIEDTGEPRIFVLPKEKATLIDNWDVLGLRATGSIDYEIDDVFVPEAYTHFATTDEGRGRSDHIHRLTVLGFAGVCHSGWALGIGRRLLDEMADLVRAKRGRPGTMADSDSFHEHYANAEGKLRSARAYVMETWTGIEETIRAGEPITTRQRTLIWHALQHATWSVHDIGMWVYLTSGTTALRDGRLQQLFRDLHAGTQHVVNSPMVIRNTGRELAGLAEGQQWIGLDLTDA